MAIERITKFSDAIQPADIINEVVDVVNNADLEEFVGASESQAGKKGIVPAPEAGSEDRYLNADGTWREVTIPEVSKNLSEYNNDIDFITKTTADNTYIKNLSINGRTITFTKGDGSNNTIITQDNDTTYSAGTGISLSGTTFSNGGVRSITAGSSANILTVDTNGTTSNITINNVANATNASNATKATQDSNGNNIASTYLPKTGGTITGNLTVNGTITGTTVIGAVYNDYAEFFPRGEETEAGDIIMLDPNSEEEKYIKASTSIITEYPLVVGVHSEEYSHLIGGELPENGEDFYDYNINKYIPVGLAGRCKVKIKGKAIKGAPITVSDIPGVGICSNNININNIVGYLVESDNIKDENTIRLLKVKLK